MNKITGELTRGKTIEGEICNKAILEAALKTGIRFVNLGYSKDQTDELLGKKQDRLTDAQLANLNANHGLYLKEHQDISGKQDVINDLAEIRRGAKLGSTALQKHQDLSDYAMLKDIPKNISAFYNDKGYLTEHQSLKGYAKLEDLPTVPQNLSAFNNDVGYIKDISGKQDKLTAEQLRNINLDHSKFLTEHQDISGKQDVINDLETIRRGAGLGATALQKHQDISGKADKSSTLAGYGITNAYTKTETDNKFNSVVHFTGNETIIGGVKKIAGNASLYFEKPSSSTFEVNTKTALSFSGPNYTIMPPWANDAWHDHLGFLKEHTIFSKFKTTDGENWVVDDRNIKSLFIEKESIATTILGTADVGFRFTINSPGSFHYAGLFWYEIGVAYTGTFSNFNIVIQSSNGKNAEGISTNDENEWEWMELHNSEITGNSRAFFCYSSTNFGNQPYLRFTFLKTTNITTGSVQLTYIKALTYRKGNQGLGIEYQFPYDWDENANILPIKNRWCDLGSYSQNWQNVYAKYFVENGKQLSSLYLSINGKAESAKSADSVAWANVSGRPTNVSSFVNDVGYLTQHQDLSNYYTKKQIDDKFASIIDGDEVSY